MKRHSKRLPCPICQGHPDLPRGQGIRCAGFVSDDGEYAHCSREDLAGQAPFYSNSSTYAHRLRGSCRCGVSHGDDPERGDRRPAAETAARRPAPVRQIGDTDRAKIVATYDYRARDGTLLYQVCRTEPKSFRQRRPCPACDNGRERDCPNRARGFQDKRPEACRGGWLWNMQGQPFTLYRIPQLFQALEAGDDVWIAEGEKDCDALWEAGVVATCNTGGAGKWRDELAKPFARFSGRRVVIVQDKDDPAKVKGVTGQQHARAVAESIAKVLPAVDADLAEMGGPSVVIVEAAEGKDAADHLAAGKGIADFVQVWPPPTDLLERDPAAFKRFMLKQALESSPNVLERIPVEHVRERHPLFPVGLVQPSSAQILRYLPGAVVLSGSPSAGKSYLAISTSVDACLLGGWDSFYFSCEMHEDIFRDRAARAAASAGLDESRALDGWYRQGLIDRAKTFRFPENFHYINVEIGVRMKDVLQYLHDHVTARPALVVFDSLSSFVDSMAEERGTDAFKMKDLREVVRWIVSARRLTHGHIAFLLLSELNKEGRAKGRFVDHRCDVAIAMESDEDHGAVKTVSVTKSWWGPTGRVGRFLLDWELGRLRAVP